MANTKSIKRLLFYFFPYLILQGCTALSNCSYTHSVCYNGPHFDQRGKIISCTVPGTIALTFDDGPAEYTQSILDTLDKYKWYGTFFLIGKNIQHNYQGILEQALQNGHQLASHTYNHPRMLTLSIEQLVQEMMLTEQAFLKVTTNLIPRYMRPPRGETTIEANALLKSMGYVEPIGWTFSTLDTINPTHNPILQYKKFLGGDNATNIDFNKLSIITLQHDTIKQTAQQFAMLAECLHSTFEKNGIRFVTVAECLNDTQPYKIINKTRPHKSVNSALQKPFSTTFVTTLSLFWYLY